MTVVTDILCYFSVCACYLLACLKFVSRKNHVFQHSLCLLGKSKGYSDGNLSFSLDSFTDV